MAEFKVGDRVRSAEDGPTRGLYGVIIDDDGSEVPLLVRFDGFKYGHGKGGNEWYLRDTEVLAATPATPPVAAQVDAINEEYGPAPATNAGGHAIVCVMKKGKPRPSSQPFVHHDQFAAALEADRLAKKHAGEQFGVYVLAETRRFDHPHEWQRLALTGQRGAAIRIIQNLTGLPVDHARLAVNAWADRA